MSLVNLPGGMSVPLGIGQQHARQTAIPLFNSTVLDATNEAQIFIGHIVTSDGGSHTIDTTGSSSLQWVTEAVTFANAGTTVKVGLGAVLLTAGPPGRAAHASDVITMDVSKSHTGGGGGITGTAWQTNVPDTGTKTIANGDLVAFSVQMTARGGADSVTVAQVGLAASAHYPGTTSFTGGAYAPSLGVPIAIIVFSDGAIGYFYATDVQALLGTRTFNSGSASVEYGQLYSLPFPVRIAGLYGWLDPDADCEIILYSDPLGTPVAAKTIAIDANTVTIAAARKFSVLFPAAYDLAANTPIAAIFKPGASNISVFYKTLGNAAHRVADSGGTSSYGVSRASGAFADANSSLDHYYIGLLVSGFGPSAVVAGLHPIDRGIA